MRSAGRKVDEFALRYKLFQNQSAEQRAHDVDDDDKSRHTTGLLLLPLYAVLTLTHTHTRTYTHAHTHTRYAGAKCSRTHMKLWDREPICVHVSRRQMRTMPVSFGLRSTHQLTGAPFRSHVRGRVGGCVKCIRFGSTCFIFVVSNVSAPTHTITVVRKAP